MAKDKKSTAQTIRAHLNALDLFTEDVQFRENGQDTFSTNFGMILSIVILLVTCLYANVKVNAFIEKDDTSHQTSEHIGALRSEDYEFDFDYNETQFAIQAVGIQFDGEIYDPVTNETYTYKDLDRMVQLFMYTNELSDESSIDNIMSASTCSDD